jgi:hypothetical protein
MRVARLILSFILTLAHSSRLNSQQSTPAPQRDAQALAVLSKMFTVSGWSALLTLWLRVRSPGIVAAPSTCSMSHSSSRVIPRHESEWGQS